MGIPDSVTSIDDGAFYGCTSITFNVADGFCTMEYAEGNRFPTSISSIPCGVTHIIGEG